MTDKIVPIEQIPEYAAAQSKLREFERDKENLERELANSRFRPSIDAAAKRMLQGEPEPLLATFNGAATQRRLQIVKRAIELQNDELARLKLEASLKLMAELKPDFHKLIRDRLTFAHMVSQLFRQQTQIEDEILSAGYTHHGISRVCYATLTIPNDADWQANSRGDNQLDREIREAVKEGILTPDDPIVPR